MTINFVYDSVLLSKCVYRTKMRLSYRRQARTRTTGYLRRWRSRSSARRPPRPGSDWEGAPVHEDGQLMRLAARNTRVSSLDSGTRHAGHHCLAIGSAAASAKSIAQGE
jgi:hypothetical protein